MVCLPGTFLAWLVSLTRHSTRETAQELAIGNSPLEVLYLFSPIPHPLDANLKTSITFLKFPSLAPDLTPSKAQILTNLINASHRARARSRARKLPGIDLLGIQGILERRGVEVERGIDKVIDRIQDQDTGTKPPMQRMKQRYCIRWNQEWIESRIEAAFTLQEIEIEIWKKTVRAKRSSSDADKTPYTLTDSDIKKLWTEKRISSTTFKDSKAAVIYHMPQMVDVSGQMKENVENPELVSILPRNVSASTSGNGPFLMSIHEREKKEGIDLYYSIDDKSRKITCYWFIHEDASWRVEIKEVDADANWAKKAPLVTNFNFRKEKLVGEDAKKAVKRTIGAVHRHADEEEPVKGIVANLYGPYHDEPIMSADLISGQLWTCLNVDVKLIDIAMTVMLAVQNLEKGIRLVCDGYRDNDDPRRSYRGFLFGR